MSEPQMKLLAAALVLRAMGQLVCNGHATLSLADSPGDTPILLILVQKLRDIPVVNP